MTAHTSKSKPEIEFQYGGRPFSETGNSFISSVDWDIEIFHANSFSPSYTGAVTRLQPEVDFRLYGRHLEKSIWRHNSGIFVRFLRYLAGWCKMTCWWLCVWVKIENRGQILMAAVRCPKPEVVLSQPWSEIFYRNSVHIKQQILISSTQGLWIWQELRIISTELSWWN